MEELHPVAEEGGRKRLYRQIDFRRTRFDEIAKVVCFEYDPNRTANIALLEYSDGEKSYILATNLKVGDIVVPQGKVDFSPGNAMPLNQIPLGTKVHCVEMLPGAGAKLARSIAGTGLRLISIDNGYASLKMLSGEIRLLKKTAEPPQASWEIPVIRKLPLEKLDEIAGKVVDQEHVVLP